MKSRRFTRSGLLLFFAAICMAAFAGGPGLKSGPGLRSTMPAGYDAIILKPSGETLSLLGLIECPELEGAQHVSEGFNARLISASGETIHEFPRHFSVRVTASLRKIFLEGPVASVSLPDGPRELLLHLKFRVRAYHALESREIAAESIEMIGMPADVPYDERVYRININAANIPITDRLVIEVLSPQGERLTHFPFSLL
ncbi:MAG TPA: hypothetical protein VH724_12165 [Candidatus Angelobacter sp.]|nr:hypothetical protein [Candidatus Angelobacter sp.]